MFLFDDASNEKLNNKGYSLIELLVVIAIMSVLVGGISISTSLLFSKDAYKAAKKIDDMLAETRTLSMSRKGECELRVTKDSDDYIAKIVNVNKVITVDGSGNNVETDVETVLSEINLGSKVKIYDGNVVTGEPTNSDAEITNGMGAGFVLKYGSSKGNAIGKGTLDTNATDGCYRIKVMAKRGGKISVVKVVKLTGRHLIEGE